MRDCKYCPTSFDFAHSNSIWFLAFEFHWGIEARPFRLETPKNPFAGTRSSLRLGYHLSFKQIKFKI